MWRIMKQCTGPIGAGCSRIYRQIYRYNPEIHGDLYLYNIYLNRNKIILYEHSLVLLPSNKNLFSLHSVRADSIRRIQVRDFCRRSARWVVHRVFLTFMSQRLWAFIGFLPSLFSVLSLMCAGCLAVLVSHQLGTTAQSSRLMTLSWWRRSSLCSYGLICCFIS